MSIVILQKRILAILVSFDIAIVFQKKTLARITKYTRMFKYRIRTLGISSR